jgi:hypothetical protein
MTRMLKMIQGAGGGGAAGPGAGGGFSEMFAAGGLVTGPGTSTSDSIPARLSAGEFVLSAKATEAIGVHTLAQVNRGVTVPAISGLGVAHFAEGGLVQAPGGGPGMDLHLGIGLDEGLVLKHLSSKAAGKVVVQHLSNNPKAANKALQRGK